MLPEQWQSGDFLDQGWMTRADAVIVLFQIGVAAGEMGGLIVGRASRTRERSCQENERAAQQQNQRGFSDEHIASVAQRAVFHFNLGSSEKFVVTSRAQRRFSGVDNVSQFPMGKLESTAFCRLSVM